MKKAFLLFTTLSVVVILNSCSKDDEGTTLSAVVETPKFESKWIYSKESSIVNGQELLAEYAHTPSCSKDYLEIKTDGTASYNYYLKGCVIEIDKYNWVKKDDKNYTFSDGKDSFNIEIVNLTTTELKIKYVNGGIDVFVK
jgi:hypothetical protein